MLLVLDRVKSAADPAVEASSSFNFALTLQVLALAEGVRRMVYDVKKKERSLTASRS